MKLALKPFHFPKSTEPNSHASLPEITQTFNSKALQLKSQKGFLEMIKLRDGCFISQTLRNLLMKKAQKSRIEREYHLGVVPSKASVDVDRESSREIDCSTYVDYYAYVKR